MTEQKGSVLDASAVLVWLQQETGADVVEPLLDGARISAVNLAEVLQNHLSQRPYQSLYLFRRGRDPMTRKGMQTNRQNAWRVCKRIEAGGRIREPVCPHRFRKTLATTGRRAACKAGGIVTPSTAR